MIPGVYVLCLCTGHISFVLCFFFFCGNNFEFGHCTHHTQWFNLQLCKKYADLTTKHTFSLHAKFQYLQLSNCNFQTIKKKLRKWLTTKTIKEYLPTMPFLTKKYYFDYTTMTITMLSTIIYTRTFNSRCKTMSYFKIKLSALRQHGFCVACF